MRVKITASIRAHIVEQSTEAASTLHGFRSLTGAPPSTREGMTIQRQTQAARALRTTPSSPRLRRVSPGAHPNEASGEGSGSCSLVFCHFVGVEISLLSIFRSCRTRVGMKTFKPAGAWRLTRTGSIAELSDYTAQSESFAAALKGPCALLVRREGDELVDFLLTRQDDGVAADALAVATGAVAVSVDVPAPLSGVRAVAVVSGDGVTGRSTLAGVDPANASRVLDRVLADGEEVLVLLARMTPRQRRRWVEYARTLEGNTEHHSTKSHVPLWATVVTTAADEERAADLRAQVMDALPGWDTATRADTGDRTRVALVFALFCVVAVVGALVAPSVWPGVVADVLRFAAGGFALAAGVRYLVPSAPMRVARACVRGLVPVPSPVKQLTDRSGWPVGRLVIPMSAPVVCSLAAPQAGAATGSTSTRARTVPPQLLGVRGPCVGADPSGRLVRLDARHLWGGVAVVGAPGTGKSELLRALFGWLLVHREQHPQSAALVVETKPDGLAGYERVASAAGHGEEVLVVEVADPCSPAVDMFARPGDDPLKRAAFIADTWAAAFGDGAIMGRSREVISAVVAAGLVLDGPAFNAYDVARAEGDGVEPLPERSWFWAGAVLTGRMGEESGRALVACLHDQAVREGEDSWAARVLAGLGIIWGPQVTTAARRTLTEAARNKFDQLREAASFLAPVGRDAVTWDESIGGFHVTVLGTGTARGGRHQLTGAMTRWLTAMAGYTMQAAVERTCYGWDEAGHQVVVMCDEFKAFAGWAPDVARWWKDDGRSHGVVPWFATQYLEQLRAVDPALLTSFLSYQTFVSLRQDDLGAAEAVARQMGRDGALWEPSEIATLSQWVAVVSTQSGGRTLPAFTMSTLNVKGDPAEFVAGVRSVA